MPISKCASALALWLGLVLTAQAAEGPTVAWLRDGQVQARTLGAGDALHADPQAQGKVPLGSLWKLFMYVYLEETRATEPEYACSARTPASKDEDVYCCTPGESIARSQALSRSCAPYFSPARVGATPQKWARYWNARQSPAWLRDMRQLRPETEVSIEELLTALSRVPAEGRAQARRALLDIGIHGYGKQAWPLLGTGLRYKTFSWRRAGDEAFGGAAGWLADGTPFWIGGRGSSRTVLATWAQQLAAALPSPRWAEATTASGDDSCVDVDFFERYPVRAVWQAGKHVKAVPGELRGRFRIEFENGNWLSVASRGELLLARHGDTLRVHGRFSMNDYVARVVDREGDAMKLHAGRALAIAARTYLVQNARFDAGCWHIADWSRTQRVSANPPSDAALAAAWFSDAMLLRGAPIGYHATQAGKNRLSWQKAVEQDRNGWDFERILMHAYPQAVLASLSGREECRRLDAAEAWLARAVASWRRVLEREAGFETPELLPRICALADGYPYADQRRLRIYVRGWQNLNERMTLAHEYLHLAFRFHPHGADEQYIERLARRLIEG
ncbi:uncharacterized protein YfaQ (DUF2300 family) [Paucimonas lemoignei]|uniref:Uncharacterized protein YfaQ (DUF2300 family) n=1 Tax=Paucimonas lemoignei TaxID=29443 RepID=A0A4V6NY05_PAULE|nr:DUF2300 domain-containing protein [Paucimonas lemoignei]TCS38270.1 uncharacterized protein YfaQ (DUF2300 family) [Paucimonas lemoignei]